MDEANATGANTPNVTEAVPSTAPQAPPPIAPQAPPPSPAAASAGLTDDVASGLAYLTIIPAIIFLVVAPYNTNPKVKFHAWQSIFLGIVGIAADVVLTIIGRIPFLGLIDLLLWPLVGLGIFILALIAMIQAFQGKRFKIPVVGDFAEKQAGN